MKLYTFKKLAFACALVSGSVISLRAYSQTTLYSQPTPTNYVWGGTTITTLANSVASGTTINYSLNVNYASGSTGALNGALSAASASGVAGRSSFFLVSATGAVLQVSGSFITTAIADRLNFIFSGGPAPFNAQATNNTTYTVSNLLITANIAGAGAGAGGGAGGGGGSASQTDTQAALLQSAAALRSVFNQQSAVVNNSLNYDCTVFAENDVCVSGGGRFATTNSITGDQPSSLLVAAYKALTNMRVGVFIDQNVPTVNITGITLDKNPMYGVFGVWNQNPDAMGYEVRLSTSYANQSISQTRNVVGTSEAGVGSASLTSQAMSGVVSYAMPVTDSTWIASPYLGVRKTKINRGGYSETSAVTAPLTYSDLTQDITTALAGVRTSKKFSDNVYVTGSVGVEQNVGSNISTLDATGVTGLTSTDFSANYAKTRPVASVGASYAIDKNQRISLSAMYRKEAFQSSGSTTGLLMYQVGL
jgi:hypothetical protein